MQIPDKAMHARLGGKRCLRPQPVIREWRRERRSPGFVIAGVGANNMTSGIQNLQLYFALSSRFQGIVENCSRWRIFTRRYFGRQRSVMVGVGADSHSRCRLEEICVSRPDLIVQFAKWRNIIQDPERAAVS